MCGIEVNTNFGIVPIEHRNIVHGIDWAQPTGHWPIVHENNCAPCRLYTLPMDTIVHQPTVHPVDCARAIRHDSIMHRYKWTPERLHTPFFEQVGTKEFSTKLTVHHRLSTIRVHTSETGHRVDWARVQLSTVSIEHDHNCAPYRLRTSTTVHHGYYSFAYLSESMSSAFCPILLKNGGATNARFLYIYFRSTGESIYAK